MSAELPASAANQAEWQRLVAAVELTPGFAIFVVVVSEPSLAEPVTRALETLMEQHGVARCERWYDSDPLDVLVAASPDRPRYQIISLVPREVGSLRDDPERTTALLMRLNQRRDVIRTRLAGPLFLLVDRERMRSFPGYAPDLWSAHAAVFRFGRGIRIDAIDIARFLISDYDIAGLLGLVPGYVDTAPSLVPSLEIAIPAGPPRLIGRERELARLEALTAGATRPITVSGSPGSGKTALVAAFARARAARGERVVWIHAEDESQILVMHSILVALRPGVPSPRCHADLARELVRTTERTAALVIVDDFKDSSSSPLAVIGRACTMVVISEERSSELSDLRVPWLDPRAAIELWATLGGKPLEFDDQRRYNPSMLEIAARSGISPMDPEQVAPSLFKLEGISSEARRFAIWVLSPLSHQAYGIPRSFFRIDAWTGSDVERMLAELEHAGILTWGDAGFHLWASFDGGKEHVAAILCAHEAEILGNLESPAHQRLLRCVVTSRYNPSLDQFSPALFWAVARTLHPSERVRWLERAPGMLAEPGDMQRELVDELLRQHVRLRLLPSFDDPLRRHAAALQRGDEAELAALDLPSEHSDALALLHACRDTSTPLPERPHGIAATILALRRPDATTTPATTPASSLPAEHFRLVGLVWQHLRADRASDSFELLQQLRASAERWGDPLALLRADLLDASAREAIGDSVGALAIYDNLAPRVDTLFDPQSSEALWLLMRRATLSERTGRHADAITLADDAWIRLRYVDEAQPALLHDLAHLFVRHAKLDRATLALARWREAVEGQPEQLREALAFEKTLVLARRDAELARIDGALAKLEPETE